MTPTDLRFRHAAWALAVLLLYLSLALHLLPALFAGLLVYELVWLIAPVLQRQLSGHRAIVASAIAIALAVIALVSLASAGLIAFLRSDAGSLPKLFAKLAEVVEHARHSLPLWLVTSLPNSTEAVHDAVIAWIKGHAMEVQVLGKEAVRSIAQIAIGMALGALVAISASHTSPATKPLAAALTERVWRLGNAFRRVVFAQVQISAINTVLTALFLGVVMPLLGSPLPLVKTLVAVTFLAGLLPVIGNLISNTLIVLVALSLSLGAGLTALVFLVVVHKLEYLLNARIVGNRIAAHAWELLLAMLVLESAFGLPGIIAAPIFYAYLKDELAAAGLV